MKKRKKVEGSGRKKRPFPRTQIGVYLPPEDIEKVKRFAYDLENKIQNMKYLDGHQLKIDSPTLKKMIGAQVEYLLERNIDKSGRGYFSSNYGKITDIVRKQVDFGNGCYESFNSIREIVLR